MTTVRSETITALLGEVPEHFGHPVLTADEWDWWLPLTERPDRWAEVMAALEEFRRLIRDDDYEPWRD